MPRLTAEVLALRNLADAVESLLDGTRDLAAVREAFLRYAEQRPRFYRRREEKGPMGGGGGVFDSDLSLPGTSSKGEISKSNTSEIGPNSGPNSRETWLSPFGSAWRQQFQANPPWGQLARALRPLVTEHGGEEVLRRWKNYLLGAGAQYVSAARFATTFGAWITADPDAWRHDPSQFRPGETTDDYISRQNARSTRGNGR